jgi:hypothetical protein
MRPRPLRIDCQAMSLASDMARYLKIPSEISEGILVLFVKFVGFGGRFNIAAFSVAAALAFAFKQYCQSNDDNDDR